MRPTNQNEPDAPRPCSYHVSDACSRGLCPGTIAAIVLVVMVILYRVIAGLL